MLSLQNITLQKVVLPGLSDRGIDLHVLRLDVIHPQISGNKWFKLKYNLEHALNNNFKTIITFGGAYSNHIVACAAACNYYQLNAVGIIRGDRVVPLNHSLMFAEQCGMQLNFVSRKDYKLKREEEFINSIKEQYPDAYIIPEGGANKLAVIGCAEIYEYIPDDTELITLACGTASTMAGIVSAAKSYQKVMGFSVLKGGEFLRQNLCEFLNETELVDQNFSINTEYHFGGYAKFNQQLIDFINYFYGHTNIPLDFVYTGKMMYGLLDLINKDEIKQKKIVAIHTGGLQGNYSVKEKFIF